MNGVAVEWDLTSVEYFISSLSCLYIFYFLTIIFNFVTMVIQHFRYVARDKSPNNKTTGKVLSQYVAPKSSHPKRFQRQNEAIKMVPKKSCILKRF